MGKKRVRGVPIDRDEMKKHHNITVTETAWRMLQEKAKKIGLSRSELIEMFARGELDKEE